MTPKPGISGEIHNFQFTLFLVHVTELPCAPVEEILAVETRSR